MTLATARADVVVIGAGPAGSAAAAHLSAAGHDVLVLERAADHSGSDSAEALTPTAVSELATLGLPASETDTWHRTTGVRFVGGGMRLALAWPDVDGRPVHGLVRSRSALAQTLSAYAVSRGVHISFGSEVTGFATDESGRVSGVSLRGANGRDSRIEAGVVIDASGLGLSQWGTKSGEGVSQSGTKSEGAVAVTADFASPRGTDDHVESWLRLADADGATLPGHGWIVGRGDGHVTVGVGALASDTSATTEKCAFVLEQWLRALPGNWELSAATMTGPIEGGRLATGSHLTPRHENGVLRLGDAAGLANPWTGEGVASALISARLAAAAVDRALALGTAAEREGELTAYDTVVRDALGSHRRFARTATSLLERPSVTRAVTTWALPREALMKLVLRRLTTPNRAALETCVTTSTMGRVTSAAAHPGNERGVDQR
ncbi:hypothetical protein N802_08800 [Knoellia sinensis KCTC 19936]|uniref:FAD-binding domain-containing protein n=1 Tax=Knoellia sinensis KCTC 19936 TaxID=1385520 RepID=A0A0A0JB21_9MICO|nr:FAD-dependent oxidoreductase [Knoellia sinensis]KGN33979.1 hypothetical protein N802_08800 [Knoellia sinensis KCTC 19936]